MGFNYKRDGLCPQLGVPEVPRLALAYIDAMLGTEEERGTTSELLPKERETVFP